MRIDKWLWCARFFKTRAIAADAVKKGRVRVNDNPVKPALVIRPGDAVSVRTGPYTHRVTVLALASGRKAAATAAQLYREDPDSIETRRLLAEQLQGDRGRYAGSRGRPGKRERRKLVAFKKQTS